MRQTAFIVIGCLLALAAGCDRGGSSGKQLNLFAQTEYVPDEVIDGFTKETGIKVNRETFNTNEEMLSKLQAGITKYDLIQPSEYTVEYLIKQNRLAPIDASKVPNTKNLAPELKELGHDPGQKYSIPWMTGTVGIVVNTAKIKEPIRGYGDVFQEKYKGRIVVVDDGRELVTWALATQGVGPNGVTKENLEKVRPILVRWHSLIKLYNSDSPKDNLKSGDVDLGVVWNGEAARLIEEEPAKWQYILPAEGAHQFVDNLCIPADALNKEAAHLFLNYILRPEVSKLISDRFPYTNPNLEARKLLSAKQLANPASYPQAAKLEIFRDIGPEMQSAIDKLVTDIKSK